MIDDEKTHNGESPDDTVEIPPYKTEHHGIEHPKSIGAFEIVRLLACGTRTWLFEARSSITPNWRFVAKVLRHDSQEARNRFACVASAMNALDHPNILPCQYFDSKGL